MVRRVTHTMQVIFWTSVPLFAVYLAVTPRDGRLGWPGAVLWLVVLASSACLTPLAFPPVSAEGVHSEARASESLVYPITLFLAVSPFAFLMF